MVFPTLKSQKVFSIIIAAYNCGSKIENTLQSTFSNNEELFELIVMDGASTDDTLEYVKKYEDRLTLVSEPDEGVYFAFNKAINLASGKYLYFIGAGDCLRSDVLQKVEKNLPAENPALIYGKCYFVKQKRIDGKRFTETLFIRDNICQQGIFYHRDIFNIIGKFDLRYKVLADWFFNLKSFMSGKITKIYVDLVIADYEEGGLSSEITCDPVFTKEFPIFIRKHFGLMKYFICKAFLKDPYGLNYLYQLEYKLLFFHIIANYWLPKKIISMFNPFFRAYKSLKKSVI